VLRTTSACAVATKVLHRKRRNLIPMLDNVAIEYYLQAMAQEHLRAASQDKRRAPSVAMTAVRAFREDLVRRQTQLRTSWRNSARTETD
jgi:Family of unknown function (DUF6308)